MAHTHRSSRHLYTPVITYPSTQSRESSASSRTSYDSRDSKTTNSGYQSETKMGHHSGTGGREDKYRVPNNASHYVKSVTHGNVKVINQSQGRYDPAEPRADQASSNEYYKSTSSKGKKHSHHHHHK